MGKKMLLFAISENNIKLFIQNCLILSLKTATHKTEHENKLLVPPKKTRYM